MKYDRRDRTRGSAAPTSRRSFMSSAGALAGGALAARALPGSGAEAALLQPGDGSTPGARFRRLLTARDPQLCVNVGDVATARLASMHGFPIIMTGGSALALSQFGLGDWGMITIDDLVAFASRVADAVETPVIADADDGGGNPLNVYRAVQRFEKAGAACVMIEDLYGAKHLTGYTEGRILAREAMVDKVHAAVEARRDSTTVILVRTDLIGSGGTLDEALDRIAAYAEAGGELIFMPGIPLDQCARAVELTRRPILTSAPSVAAARQNRVQIVFMGQMGGIALGAVDRAMRELNETGQVQTANHPSLSAADRNRLMGSDAAVDRAKRYNALGE